MAVSGTEEFQFCKPIPVLHQRKGFLGCFTSQNDAVGADVQQVKQSQGCRLAISSQSLVYLPGKQVSPVRPSRPVAGNAEPAIRRHTGQPAIPLWLVDHAGRKLIHTSS